MKRLAFVFALLFSFSARTETIQAVFDGSCQGTCNMTKLTAKAGNTANWTGWIYVGTSRRAIFDVSFTDTLAADSTAITMRCESSGVNTTATDAGFDVPGHSTSCVSPTCTITSYPALWSTPPPATATTVRTSWIVDDIPDKWVNCYFAITGGVAAESYTVSARGALP